jgi:hypothetical protein
MAEARFEVTEERKKFLMNKVAQKIVDLRMTPVAVVMLESSKPLSFLANQFMVFMQPFYRAFFSFREYEEFAAMLEDRNNIEVLICEIERVEEELHEHKRADKNSRH